MIIIIMYDSYKPDLIVDPLFSKAIQVYNLDRYFNILDADSLTISYDIKPYVVTDYGVNLLENVQLQPFYKNDLRKCSGSAPDVTSYWFDTPIRMYNIEENGPRYVIWSKDKPLPVCATYVDRINSAEIFAACQRALQWATRIEGQMSIIVFDLDDTLINSECCKLAYADKLLKEARRTYNLLVLYSHGSALHVDGNVTQFTDSINDSEDDRYSTYCCNRKLFDLVLSNNGEARKSNKNLLYLYKHFPNVRFTKATLVDDSLFNWTPEYTRFVVPTSHTLKYALSVI